MWTMLQDLCYASRSLGKRPLYGLMTVVVFALAIGANSTVFSVFNGLFLRPLPYPDDDRLVMVYSSYPKMGLEDAGTSIPDYLDRREQVPSLESLAMLAPGSVTLHGEYEPQQLSVARTSPSAVAFALAVVGIYSVLTSAVAQRVGEIGVRMALGARMADIVRMILGQGVRMTSVGLVVGSGAAIVLGRVLSARIEYVGGFDALVLAVAAAGLAGTAFFASWLPARRASRIDPMQALRED